MSKPQRIQRKRTKGWRMPEGAVYVGRGTEWGNPWIVERFGCGIPVWVVGRRSKLNDAVQMEYRAAMRCEACAVAAGSYRAWLPAELRDKAKRTLRGKILACWCPLDQPCHADVLLEIANA